MRDPARIARIIEKLWTAWEAQPDSRLTQLIVNLVRPSEPCPRVFSFEDSDLEARLDALVGQLPTDGTHAPQ